jgi:uncharacterized coiled-coil DUF342 family protein
MPRQNYGRAPLDRLEIMEKESRLRKEINSLRYKRQNLITEIIQKRNEASELREKRDTLNAEVRELVGKGKAHIKKRNELQGQIKSLKDKRSDITQGIGPKAEMMRSEQDKRWRLNRAARSTKEDILADFTASLKTLFEMDLSLRDEVIMVEMIMDVKKRYLARESANEVHDTIRDGKKEIRKIQNKASNVTSKIISLAADGETEHQAAMELFDRKDELSAESQALHDRYIGMTKEIRSISKTIDDLSREIDEHFKDIKPIRNKLDRARITRREEQQLEQLKVAKNKMETSGKIDLNDLRVLMESRALDLKGSDERGNRQKGKKRD